MGHCFSIRLLEVTSEYIHSVPRNDKGGHFNSSSVLSFIQFARFVLDFTKIR